MGLEAICHFQATAIAGTRKAPWFHLRMSRILFAANTNRPLFVGSYLQLTWWALGQ